MPNTAAERRTYQVEGMTCDHCVLSVTEGVMEVPGVQDVEVELASGRLTVAGAGFTDDAVKGAVEAAGYEVACWGASSCRSRA
jgi:copper chaperone CopZ